MPEESFQLVHLVNRRLRKCGPESFSTVFEEVEQMIDEYREDSSAGEAIRLPKLSRESSLVSELPNLPKYGDFKTRVPLGQAFAMRDREACFSARRHVPIHVDEVRDVFNLAQIIESAKQLQLATFDGDETLWPDRTILGPDNPLVDLLRELLHSGIHVALVTAVGFPESEPYEERLRALLDVLGQDSPPGSGDLLCVGGQSNYYFRFNGERLMPLPVTPTAMLDVSTLEIEKLLDVAEDTLRREAENLCLEVRHVRKARAVGCILGSAPSRSSRILLDELALRARAAIKAADITAPFCTFNGGCDAFIDVGSKDIGIGALQSLCGVPAAATLHFGDQFTRTGNDLLARKICPTIWSSGPSDTAAYVEELLDMRLRNME